MQRRLGLELPESLDIRGRQLLAAWAEGRGYTDVYIAEIRDPDAFVTAAVAAAATTTVRLGTCVVQLGPRSVPMIASSTATVAGFAPGRFALGLGVSSEALVGAWHGVSWERPMLRARESIGLIRRLLAGERSNDNGEQVRSKGYQLAFPPDAPPPVHLAALNPAMLRLAGELADGVWLNYLPIDSVHQAIAEIDRGADAAGRPRPETLLSVYCEVTDDPEPIREMMRASLAFYLASPAYRKAWSWYGFESEMAEADAAFAARDKARVIAAVSDRLLDAISLIGDRQHVLAGLERYWAAGITSPSLCQISDTGFAPTLEALAGLVAPTG